MTEELAGRAVVITGRLASMPRREAEELIRARGGLPQANVTRGTDVLVVGADGLPLATDGGIGRKLQRAMELRDAGRELEILDEDGFLRRLGFEPESRQYTIAQLARVLGIPGRRIRTWVRRGLIRPVRVVHRLAYFELRQAAALRTLAGLVDGGATPARIRRSLDRIARWCPESGDAVSRLEVADGDLLLRLEDGGAAEPGGQLRLRFDGQEAGEALAGPAGDADWFEEGLRLEDAGEAEAAVAAYERAVLAEAGTPEIRFNLGNVLHGLGRTEDAEARYREAVEIDPGYVEAWNNLGNARADRGDRAGATAAFERALEIEPDYADAHFNLAGTLEAAGDRAAARSHWRAYLAQDSRSPWADRARRALLDK